MGVKWHEERNQWLVSSIFGSFFPSLLFYFDTRHDLRTKLALDAYSIGREEVLGGRSSVAALFAVCIRGLWCLLFFW
jgi:hypothetical protein